MTPKPKMLSSPNWLAHMMILDLKSVSVTELNRRYPADDASHWSSFLLIKGLEGLDLLDVVWD